MDFALFDHLDVRAEPPAQTFSDRIELIRAAEQAGFRAYHLAEHHGTPLGLAPSPGMFLAAAARETARIRLGAMVYCLPLYIPLRLIEEICMLDHLSAGRLDVGVGRGASPIEAGFFGVPPEQSVERYVEALQVLRQGLGAEVLNFEGRHYQYKEVPIVVRPLQEAIPFWAAPAAPDAITHAARDGMRIMVLGARDRVKQIADAYRQAWIEEPAPPDRPDQPVIGACRLVHVDTDEKKARRRARAAFESWFDKLALLWRKHNATTPILSIENFDKASDIGMMIAGSPEQVADELAAQAEHCGFNYSVLQFSFGDLPQREQMRSLELFAGQVMPRLGVAP